MTSNLAYLISSQRGLTIAELALIVVVFGLIVAGALKGCEMMSRAEIINTVKQIEKIDSALMRFNRRYNALPGDIADAPYRLPGCDATCRPDSGMKSNGIIDSSPEARQAPGMESVLFWRHLGYAGLLDFVNKKPDNPDSIRAGDGVPRTKTGGAFVIGYHNASENLAHVIARAAPPGHYLTLSAAPDKALGAQANWPLNARQLRVMDNKLDDGKPNNGKLLAGGKKACVAAQAEDAGYTASRRAGCTLFYRLAE